MMIGLFSAGLALMSAPAMVAQELAITEILAVNSSGLRDADGDTSDWIEIGNLGMTGVDLAGAFLTDERVDRQKWRFPAVELAPGELLVVFASGKDRSVAGQELHTNFKLSGDGSTWRSSRPTA